MKKYSLSVVLTAIFAVAVFGFVSCDAVIGVSGKNTAVNAESTGVAERLNVEIFFTENTGKSLGVESDTTPVSYKYQAVCLSNSSAYGSKESLTDLETEDDKAKITLAPGTWNITICGFNGSGGLVVRGESGTVNLSSASRQVEIVLTDADGEADSRVNFTLGAPQVENGQVEIKFGKSVSEVFGKSSPDKTLTQFVSGEDAFSEREGFLKFSDTLNIKSGTYIMQVLYTDSVSKISGQIVGFKAVEKTPVEISGNFDYGLYVNPDIGIEIKPTMLSVELSGDAPHFTANVLTSGTDNLTYTWIVNGDEILADETGKTLAWTPEECGFYNITCIVSGKVGHDTLYGFGYGTYEKRS